MVEQGAAQDILRLGIKLGEASLLQPGSRYPCTHLGVSAAGRHSKVKKLSEARHWLGNKMGAHERRLETQKHTWLTTVYHALSCLHVLLFLSNASHLLSPSWSEIIELTSLPLEGSFNCSRQKVAFSALTENSLKMVHFWMSEVETLHIHLNKAENRLLRQEI